MGLKTGEQYKESLRDGRNVYISGERVSDVTTHPAFRSMVENIARLYDMHFDAEIGQHLTTTSNGERVSRFHKFPETREDLEHVRLGTLAALSEIGGTLDRFGDETASALFTLHDNKDILQQHDARYAAAVDHWLGRLQSTQEFMTSANTDPKGDRSKQPFEQDDLDMHVRVVEENDDGIVIRGAKFETGASYANVAFVKPTVGSWGDKNKDFAVACVVPLNHPNITHICRRSMASGTTSFDRPLTYHADEIDTLIVMDNVFVPWQDVFFSRNPVVAQELRAHLHRFGAYSYLIRALSKADLLVGAALMVTGHSKLSNIPSIQEKLSQLMLYRQTIYGHVISAEADCYVGKNGVMYPGQTQIYAGRMYAALNYHHAIHTLRDLAGGSAVLVPDRASLESSETGGVVKKYFRVGSVEAEDRLRVLNLVADLTSSSYAGQKAVYQMFAESPPHVQAATLFRSYDQSTSIARAKRILERADELDRILG
ncbi:4-hydroxyphenylacetate 3-hydroxylase family protein [Allopusillimonas ginsengisoli]|uniref:4-hydroxyphenylacetate 3-hydroxylase family protein n=1 Tax=Allopusillimonas ginsengisoli TaxID=453575 RepID=UPI0010217CE3|nr:4-hydroxyphenylacetate 3-hydroxylase N-terminal domain-containing protein [Allopusillimonas ginsengisoli]TEA79664.1 4-hydroxyphenylacetate 3-hydroxylase [Allopusillimonas ginsengisoli]